VFPSNPDPDRDTDPNHNNFHDPDPDTDPNHDPDHDPDHAPDPDTDPNHNNFHDPDHDQNFLNRDILIGLPVHLSNTLDALYHHVNVVWQRLNVVCRCPVIRPRLEHHRSVF
jgi:hypothetical protein